MPSMGNIVNDIVITFIVTDNNQNYYGDHFATYRNTELLCCTLEQIVLQDNYTSIINGYIINIFK